MSKFFIFIVVVAAGVLPSGVVGEGQDCGNSNDGGVALIQSTNCCTNTKCCTTIDAENVVSCNNVDTSQLVTLTDLLQSLALAAIPVNFENIFCSKGGNDGGRTCSADQGTCMNVFIFASDKSVQKSGSICCVGKDDCSKYGCNLDGSKNVAKYFSDKSFMACCSNKCSGGRK